MAAVHDFISEALKAGHSMDSIVADLSQSEDSEEQAFAKNWLANSSKPEYTAGGTETSLAKTITPMLDVVNENPKTTLGILGGIAATTAGVKAYNAYQDRRMKREAHESELEKNRAYAKQVELSAQKQLEGPTTQDIIEQTKQMNKQVKQPVVTSTEGLPQATPVGGMTQQSALPQGYGQQTMNAPTGAPAVPPTAGAGPQPVAPAAPAPVDPIQAAKIREAEAKAAIAEHKLQQLQAGPKTAPASAKGSVSEADLKLLQQHGFNETSKELQAKEAASKLAPSTDAINKNTPAAEVQGAVNVVKQQELKTGTGKPAIPGAAEPTTRFKSMYGSAAEVPKTHAFVPGAQYIDVLRNDLGQPTYTEQFSKREFPQTYLESVEAGKNINRELNRPTREQLKAQGAALPEPTEGITQKAAGKKLVKVGGVAGALIALSDLAKAETTKEREQAIGNALLGLLPPGMDVGEAGAPTLSREQRAKQEEIALLGSPFYNTQAAKNIRQAKKVGAGRGIAPPSAYQR